MTETILVFGALGRVGSAIINALPANTAIRAADITDQGDFPANVEPVIFDFNNPPDDLTYLFANVRGMFLLWPPGVAANKAMEPVIQAAEAHGVKQVVFLSILGADKLKVVPHRSVEKMLEASGMDWVFVRSAYFMQNLTGMHAPEIRDQDEIFVPAGHGTLGFVDVRDVGAVAAKALSEGHGKQAYSLTGGEALTFTQVAERFTVILQRSIRYSHPGIFRFFRHMRQRGISTGLVIFMIIEYTATKLGKSGRVTDEVERLLGRPPITMQQFIADNAEVWQT